MAIDDNHIRKFFFPNEARSENILSTDKNFKLAYYTSIDTAFSIFEHKNIWMRNTKLMNDSSEIKFAHTKFIKLLRDGKLRDQLVTILKRVVGDRSFNGEMARVSIDMTLDAIERVSKDTSVFITCFSEHVEGDLGRLSMWRAYGRANINVALIFKYGFGRNTIRPLKVEYCNENGMEIFLSQYLKDMLDNIDTIINVFIRRQISDSIGIFSNKMGAKFSFVKNLGEADILFRLSEFINSFATSFQNMTFFIKHDGFKEEREWRSVYFQEKNSKLNVFDISPCIVNGMPQKVVHYPFYNDVSGKCDHSLQNLLDHIIIGPCNYPEIAKEAILVKANECGITLKDDQVRISGIPFRGNY